MKTAKQQLGDFGENLIQKKFNCPKCKRSKTLKKLPPNFKCADIICDFCGYLAQVKTHNVKDISQFPKRVLGAAWDHKKKGWMQGYIFLCMLFLNVRKNIQSFIFRQTFKQRKCLLKENHYLVLQKEQDGRGIILMER